MNRAIIQVAGGTSSTCPVYSDGGPADSGCVPTVTTHGQALAVLLSNRAALTCPALQTPGSRDYANFDLLTLEAFTETGTLATGTYNIVTSENPASGALAGFQASTSTCTESVNLPNATAGTVTLMEVSSTSVAGTYSVTFGTQGTFTGSFDVPICSLPDGIAPSNAGPAVCTQ